MTVELEIESKSYEIESLFYTPPSGKAWAAIKNDEIKAIILMSEFIWDKWKLPHWIRAMVAIPDYAPNSQKWRKKVEAVVYACDDAPKPKRRERYKVKELIKLANQIEDEFEAEAFQIHRRDSRASLAELGEVVSGRWEQRLRGGYFIVD